MEKGNGAYEIRGGGIRGKSKSIRRYGQWAFFIHVQSNYFAVHINTKLTHVRTLYTNRPIRFCVLPRFTPMNVIMYNIIFDRSKHKENRGNIILTNHYNFYFFISLYVYAYRPCLKHRKRSFCISMSSVFGVKLISCSYY